jgi:Protein of unknown function (DUF3134)
MATQYNPSLREEPQNQPTTIVPLIPRESLLSWLESSGRFRSSENDEFPDSEMPEDLDDFLEPENQIVEEEEEPID